MSRPPSELPRVDAAAREATADTLVAGARAAGVDRLDAQLLVAHVLSRSRSWLLAHGDEPLHSVDAEAAHRLLTRRAGGEPLAYLVGTKEFHGLALQVDARVLVPRPDTEVLVDWALERLTARPPGAPAARVVDLGTGSGAIALALKHRHPAAEVWATDASADALDVARANAARLGLALHWRQGDWWDAVGDAVFDLAISNPPYIAAGDAHLDALRHEPTGALTPGGDGLGALRALAAGATHHLAPGGQLLLEHGHDQAAEVAALLARHGFEQVATRRDLAGLPRCTGGHRRP